MDYITLKYKELNKGSGRALSKMAITKLYASYRANGGTFAAAANDDEDDVDKADGGREREGTGMDMDRDMDNEQDEDENVK